MKKLVLLVASLAWVAAARADGVDDLIRRAIEQQRIPGLALIVVRDGEVVKRQAYGFANLETKEPVRTDSVFETGSIGKSFTAIVTMQLVHEGKLSLDDPVAKRFPSAPEAWKGITIRHLLSHQSGLPEYVVLPGLGLVDEYSKEQWLQGVLPLPLDFAPGRMFQYSNTNFALLGYILESVTGKPYGDLVTERVFLRAGMADTHFMGKRRDHERLAPGYMVNAAGQLETGLRTTTSGSGADGMFLSTCADLAKFAQAVQSGKLLPNSLVKRMHTPATTAAGHRALYGLGFFVRTANGKRFVSHGGNSVGYSASVAMFPDSGLTVALMCNLYPVGGDSLARQIAEIYDPSLASVPGSEQADPHPKLTSWILGGLHALAEGRIEDRAIDADYAAQLKTPRGQMSRPGLAVFRNIRELRYLGEESDGFDRTLRYQGIGGDRKYLVSVVVTPEHRIYSAAARPE